MLLLQHIALGIPDPTEATVEKEITWGGFKEEIGTTVKGFYRYETLALAGDTHIKNKRDTDDSYVDGVWKWKTGSSMMASMKAIPQNL